MDKTKSIKEKIVQISNELRLSKEGTNAFQKYQYFRPDDIAKAINPLLEKYHLIAIFNMPFNKEKGMYEGSLTIESVDSDEKVSYIFDIPLTKVQGTSEAQGAGATMTYCKRYMIQNAFNLAENELDLDSMNHKEIKTTDSKDDVCPKCDGIAKYKEGIKNKKHWQGWFCQNKDCNNVVWGPKKYDNNKAQDDQEKAEEIPVIEEDGPSEEQLEEVFGKEE